MSTTPPAPSKARIEALKDDPVALERLYRQALRSDHEATFHQAISECLADSPANLLLTAWACRLESDAAPDPPGVVASISGADGDVRRHWIAALLTAVGCGALFTLLTGNGPPVPIPGEASSLFWIGWGPLTAVAIVVFVAAIAPERERLQRCGAAVAVAVGVGLACALTVWGTTDQPAILVAVHLPFVAWSIVGATVVVIELGKADRPAANHFYAFIMKSMEAIVAAGIFLGAGLVFSGLTVGIFAALGVQLPENVLRLAAAFGIGVIPVVAVASVYDPTLPPTRQSMSTGLTRILRIMTWLLMPLALGVLSLYVFWFIPTNFWRPFLERDVLIVYNATIIAILMLLAAAVSGASDDQQPTDDRVLRRATLSLVSLTMLLNLYALAAVAYRTIEGGLTPNRHTVLGWNAVTLLMFGYTLVTSWRAEHVEWSGVFRTSLARALVLAIVWALWVVLGIPLLSTS